MKPPVSDANDLSAIDVPLTPVNVSELAAKTPATTTLSVPSLGTETAVAEALVGDSCL
jgi:hypothetical protein